MTIFIKELNTVSLIKRKRVVSFSRMLEVDTLDAGNTDQLTIDLDFLIDYLELVALLKTVEINLPCEDVNKTIRYFGRYAQVLDGRRK